MERSSRNFQSSSNDRKLQAKFASANRYFTENARWVPLNKFRILRQREMWFPKSWTSYRLRYSGQDLSYCKLWTLRKESHFVAFVITQSVSNQSITESHRHLSRKNLSLQPFHSQPSSVILEKTLTFSCANEEYNTNSH